MEPASSASVTPIVQEDTLHAVETREMRRENQSMPVHEIPPPHVGKKRQRVATCSQWHRKKGVSRARRKKRKASRYVGPTRRKENRKRNRVVVSSTTLCQTHKDVIRTATSTKPGPQHGHHSSSRLPISPLPLLLFLPSFSMLSRFRTLPTTRSAPPSPETAAWSAETFLVS